MRQDVYSGTLKLYGEESSETVLSANNYASFLHDLTRFKEAKALLRKTMPVARRVLGEDNEITLKTRWIYAEALCNDPTATLVDQREAATTLEDTERTARRVLGSAHPLTVGIEDALGNARAALRAHESRQDAAHDWIRKYF